MAKAKVGLVLVLTGALALLALGSPALAKDGDVIVREELLGEEHGEAQAERRERPDRGGARGRPEPKRPWTVVLTRDGTRVARVVH